MRVQRQGERLVLSFSVSEGSLLLRTLARLATSYHLKPDELDPRASAVWYSKKGCASAKLSETETHEWLEHLHTLRKAGSTNLEHWARQLTAAEGRPPFLKLSGEAASAFLVALNDYRLMTAACHDIGEKEMSIHSPTALSQLPPARREALFEVHFLAWIVEETIHALQEG